MSASFCYVISVPILFSPSALRRVAPFFPIPARYFLIFRFDGKGCCDSMREARTFRRALGKSIA
jgi:hypothetical protein